MNVDKLSTSLSCIGYMGVTLSQEQWIVLENSLTILQADNHFKNVYLWGVILGQEADYYIAYGYEKDALFGRKFFYSNNLMDWGVLPEATLESKKLTEICYQRFQGDPALVVEIVDDDPGMSPEELKKKRMDICMAGGDPADLMQEAPVLVSQLKEEDRLASTVEQINSEAVVVPRGVLLKEPDGYVVINGAFEGLSPDDCEDLKSFVHYRKPIQKWNTNLIARKDYNYALDFLDTIDMDIPKGCWTVQEQKGGRLFTLSNMYWPGFVAYHWTNTNDWGYLYYGNGRKDLDVPFMLFS
ncbi:hypothetical protein RUM43_009698 [Polyplax serrata]|uniref:Radial spoke head protein 9 homolog n=1 Tax=Polyplax serrata TaxID=468196 RepID=A0AAN8PUQ5_POLSC